MLSAWRGLLATPLELAIALASSLVTSVEAWLTNLAHAQTNVGEIQFTILLYTAYQKSFESWEDSGWGGLSNILLSPETCDCLGLSVEIHSLLCVCDITDTSVCVWG